MAIFTTVKVLPSIYADSYSVYVLNPMMKFLMSILRDQSYDLNYNKSG